MSAPAPSPVPRLDLLVNIQEYLATRTDCACPRNLDACLFGRAIALTNIL
jgi:hypothetical protein